jgi:hypothetical protein
MDLVNLSHFGFKGNVNGDFGDSGSSPILVVEHNLPLHRVLKHAFRSYEEYF